MSTNTSHLSWVGDLVLKLSHSMSLHIVASGALASGVEADLLFYPSHGCGGCVFLMPLPREWRYSCGDDVFIVQPLDYTLLPLLYVVKE